MIQLLLIIILIVCVLLVLIVMVQNPKGGGLSANFSSSSQLMGVQKTGDFLEKGTWGFAIVLMVLAMAVNVAVKGGSSSPGTDNSGSRAGQIKTQPATQQSPSPFSNTAKPAGGGTVTPATPAPKTGK